MNLVFEVNLPSNGSDDRVVHTRRAHTKSRGGCNACREKRIKCDEQKPSCIRCSKLGSACIYPLKAQCSSNNNNNNNNNNKNDRSSVEHDTRLLKRMSGSYAAALQMSVDNLEVRLDEIVSNSMSYRSSDLRRKCMRDLQHFNYVTAGQLGSCESTARLQQTLHNAVWHRPYLMHMVLAVSNAHLKRLYRSEDAGNSMLRQSIYGETVHWQLALRLYRQELSKIQLNVREYTGDLDAMMVTTCLNTIFMFSLEDEVPLDTFTTADPTAIDNSLTAYTSTNGFRVMVPILEQVDNPSNQCKDIVSTTKATHFFDAVTIKQLKDLPAAFVDLFELTEETEKQETFYHSLISRFLPLLLIKPVLEDMPLLFAFIGDAWPTLKPRISSRDPRSLLILAWWLALIHRLGLWWLNTRAETQCLSIVEYLQSLNDPTLSPFLEFPTSFGEADYQWIWKSGTVPLHLREDPQCVLMATRHRKTKRRIVPVT